MLSGCQSSLLPIRTSLSLKCDKPASTMAHRGLATLSDKHSLLFYFSVSLDTIIQVFCAQYYIIRRHNHNGISYKDDPCCLTVIFYTYIYTGTNFCI